MTTYGGQGESVGYTELRNEREMLNREIVNIRRSETYRVGRLVTFIPRKIKALLKKLLRR